MRILYLSSPPYADCDFPLIKEFQNMGHEVYYLIDLPPYFLHTTLIDIKKQIKENGIFKASKYKEFLIYKDYLSLDNIYVINRTRKSAFNLKNISTYYQLVLFIQKIKPDIINIVGNLDVHSLALLVFKKKLVLTVHDPFPHTGEQSFRKELFRRLAMKTIPQFILLNRKQKEDFIRTYKLHPSQVFINRLGIYDCIHIFLNGNKRFTSQKDKTQINLLFFGRISPYKGIEYLLKAMKIVHKSLPNVKLTIAGSGKIYFDISPFQNLSYIDIQNRYISMTELADLINRTTIVVCPYTDATQSGVIMTAYSLCKPVIATHVGGLVEMIEDGKSGVLIPPKDVDALANAIINISLDLQKRLEMEEYIKKQYFLGNKSWKNIAERYISIYTQHS